MLFATQAHEQESPVAVLGECRAITAQDLTTLNKGQAIGRLIKLGDDPDIAIMGAVRLDVPTKAYIDWYRHVENYKYSEMVKEAAQFHVSPRLDDLLVERALWV